MLRNYIKPENLSEEINSLVQDTRGGIPTAVFGVSFSEKCHLASSLDLPVIYIARDELNAKAVCRELRALSGKKAVHLPAKDDVLLFNKAFNKESLYARIYALYQLSLGADFLVATFESLLQLIPKKIESFEIVKGNEYPFDFLIEKLISFGFSRVDEIEKKGEFTVRGDILQIFPINTEAPIRLDFFGDELEKIRYFDTLGGKIEGEINSFAILPTVDFSIDASEIPLIKDKLKKEISSFGVSIFASKARDIVAEINNQLDFNLRHPCLSFVAPLLDSMKGTLKDYMGENAVVVYDEGKLLNDSLVGTLKEHVERCLSLKRNGECFSFTVNQLKSDKEIAKELNLSRKMSLQSLTTAIPFFSPLKT